MIDNQQNENLVELLKQALMFYADEGSYGAEFMPTLSLAPIFIDKGFQARFALSKIEEFNESNRKMQEEYDKLTNDMIKEIDDDSNSIEMGNFIKAFNNLSNENKNKR